MNKLQDQWDNMLHKGIYPMFELEIIDNDYLIVNLSLSDNSVLFEFDTDFKDTYFDGDIKEVGGGVFELPLDKYFDDLDSYLETISDNLMEGYLIPNNLMRGE